MLTNLTEIVRLSRDVPGILIPDGTPVSLSEGERVTIKQALGGDYTVRTECGDQVRIAGEDADALGKKPTAPIAPEGGPFNEKNVWKALKKVYDPEIPLNVVDLGLVYDARVTSTGDDRHRIDIQMTLTAPGCGMGEVLRQDVIRKVSSLPGVEKVNVEIVFDPPWSRDRMSTAAKLQLGML